MILNIHIYKVLAGPLTRLARRDDLFCFYFCFAFIFFLLFLSYIITNSFVSFIYHEFYVRNRLHSLVPIGNMLEHNLVFSLVS